MLQIINVVPVDRFTFFSFLICALLAQSVFYRYNPYASTWPERIFSINSNRNDYSINISNPSFQKRSSLIQQDWSTQSERNQYLQCPQIDDHHVLFPCTCNSSRREILCRGGGSSTGGSASEQLKKTFEFYSKWIPSSMQRFDSIYINLRNFTTIEADLFKGLKFANILLSGGELTFIHRDAFVGTEQHIYTMFIYGTNLSSKVNTDQDFFASIRKLVNLQKLIIFQNKLIEIPHNAFALESLAQNNETQTKKQLTEIQITEGSIVSIGTDAFADLMHLEQLSLNKNRINLIRSYAFRIHHKSNATLILDLTDNDLSPISFETNAFLGANRPLKIHLGLNGCNHKLDRLPEEIFRPFLDENPSNTIDVGRNCLNLKCGCQMAWMLSERYRLRVKNFRCYDSQNHSVYFSDYIRDDSCQYTRPNKFFSIAVSNNSTQSTDKAKNFDPNSMIHLDEIADRKEEKFNTSLDSQQSNYPHRQKPQPGSNLSSLNHELCASKKCAKQTMEMNTYLNRSVDPCNSFYDFACNGWENKHLLEYLVQVLSNGGSEFDNFVKAQLKIEENFEKILLLHNENNESNGYEQGMIGVNAVQTPTVWSDPTVGPSSSSMSIQSNSSLSVPSEQLSLFSTTSRSLKDSEPLIAIAKLSPSSSNLILPIVNTRKIYTRCVNANKEINQVALEKVLSDIGGWPLLTGKFNRETYRWENYFDVVVSRYNDRIFFDIETGIDENQIKYLMIKSVGFIVSRRKLLSVKLNRLESYANYIHSTLIHFGASNHKNDTIDQVWKMIKFEKKLAEISKKSIGSEFLIQRPLQTIGCLIEEIDWLYIFNNLQRNVPLINQSAILTSKTYYNVQYLIELSKLLSRTDQQIIANYIGWRVFDMIGFQFGGVGFIDIQQNFYSTESKEGLKSLKKQCLEPLVSSMPYLMARIFADKHLPLKSREIAKQIIESVKSSFIESMERKNWIDEPKKQLIDKIKNININIGYPMWIYDDQSLTHFYSIINYTSVGSNTTQESYAKELLHFYSKVQANKIHQIFEKVGDKINKSHLWDPLPLHVGATYDFVGHIVTIPMGLLQPPFFEDDRPFYLNFASLGSFFGHEIAHSVTPRYNEFDELLPPWNANFLKEYLFKAQCFVSQYTSYYDKEAELHLDGTKTFEEDMSDLAGIQAAYLAFRNISKHFGGQQSSEQSSLNSQRIQELTEYSNDKLFFISFAQKWCRSNTHLQTRMRISKSVHSPEKYRVNGALSNFKEFSRIFDCPEGSPMNPVKRCEI